MIRDYLYRSKYYYEKQVCVVKFVLQLDVAIRVVGVDFQNPVKAAVLPETQTYGQFPLPAPAVPLTLLTTQAACLCLCPLLLAAEDPVAEYITSSPTSMAPVTS